MSNDHDDTASDDDVEDADRRNGEPGATDTTENTDGPPHRTGEAQAAKNRAEDPPA